MAKKPYIIALEEHYLDPEVKQLGGGPGAGRDVVERLDDLGALRLKEMDEAGIDIQVLSHANPSLQKLDAATAVPLARRVNDRLHAAVLAHPDRFAGFAALPTADPKAAADELERTVTKLGFSDIILDVAGKSVSEPADVRKALADARSEGKRAVLMRVKSGEGMRYLAIPLGRA